MTKRDRGDYFKKRRERMKNELREALERAEDKTPAGKALTETVLVRMSGDMVAALDRARTAGLFTISRSEWIRNTLAEKLSE